MEKRYTLNEIQDRPGRLVLTDTAAGVALEFERHRYNETQRVRIQNEKQFTAQPDGAQRLAAVLRGIGDWMAQNHYSEAMPGQGGGAR